MSRHRFLSAAALLLVGVLVAILTTHSSGTVRLTEEERVAVYHQRNYSWPLSTYQPNHAGWKAVFEKRLAQIAALPQASARYEGYYQTLRPAILVPNLTEHGFGLAKCPPALLQALQEGIRDGLPTARTERPIEAIDAPELPKFVTRSDLTRRVLHELQAYAETWAQTPLTAHRAYGFRLYQNQSRLYMHVDRGQTHVVSFILHVGSSDDAEPWPIYIEDLQGRTHSVVLTPGDILFYESSKCFHGRPQRFHGSWYTSLFVHYYPKYGWSEQDHGLESHYAVPPHWIAGPTKMPPNLPRLEMVGTSLKEPDCPNAWCATTEAVAWTHGPGQTGVWIAPDGKRHRFYPQRVDRNEKSEEL